MKILVLFLALCAMESGAPENTYRYLHDGGKELTLDDVKKATFQSATDNNLGLENGTYWFRIDDNLSERSILELKNAHVEDLYLYDATGKLIPSMTNTRYSSFFLINRTLTYPLYMKASFPLEAYFPIHNSTEKEFSRNDKLSLLSLGFFYGSAIALIIATFIFYIIVRNSQFLFFSILIVAISLSITGKDNIFYLLGLEPNQIMILESLGHLVVGLSATGFMLYYLKVRKHQMWIKHIMIALSVISIASWITFTISRSVYAFNLVDITSILTTAVLWLLIIQIAKGGLKILLSILYPINICILSIAFILHTYGIVFFEITVMLASLVAVINFTLIAINLLLSIRDIQKTVVKRKLAIDKYVEQIKELDTYKTMQDADDSYMESLIYTFKLDNLEIKVLTEISNGRSNGYIENKYDLSDKRLAAVTNSIYTKLGINDDQLSKGIMELAV